eukprot:538551-Ditylum_brightwellii.AAC.1
MACHSLAVASTLVAINMRCAAVTVIVGSGGKGIYFEIAFFVPAVINFRIMEVIKSAAVTLALTKFLGPCRSPYLLCHDLCQLSRA